MNGNGYIEMSELREALKLVGCELPGYQVRALEDEFKKSDTTKDGKLSIDEFEGLYERLKKDEDSRKFRPAVKPMTAVTQQTSKNSDSIVHTIRDSEQLAFTKWINQ